MCCDPTAATSHGSKWKGWPTLQGSTFELVVSACRDSLFFIALTNIYVGVCCPGGVIKALQYEEWEWSRVFSTGHVCGAGETAIINGRPTGYEA